MIEIYLATLLFGLGTMYNNTQNKTQLKEQTSNIEQDENPYNQQLIKKVKKAEKELGKKLDVKCKSILPRNFSNLLDDDTSKLLKENENDDVLKYVPKTNNKIKSSLTGEEVNLDQFITSQTIGRDNTANISSNTWAIPYFKGTATQNMSLDGYKNKLDVHTGRSEFNFHKKETKNFFKPNKNITFVNGSPNVLDKLEDRYVKSNNRNTELPFEQIKVGRGVGQSYGNKGKGGFHQFEINEIAKPKNVDELRSISNPKKSYSEPVQTGKSGVDKRSSIAKVVRHRPEKTHHQTKKDFIAPKSVFTKNTHRSKIIVKDIKRKLKAYTGSPSPACRVNPTLKAGIKKDTKNTYINYPPNNASNPGAWTVKQSNNQEAFQSKIQIDDEFDISSYGKDGIKLPPNERDTTQNKSVITNLVSAIKSIIAPLQDKMKRTRKENIEGNPNMSGYMGTSIPKKLTVYDPNDIARTTIKETTEINEHTGNMNSGIKKLTVYDPNDIARTTIKETTEVNKMETQIKGATKLTVYDPNDVARTTLKETLIHDTRTGNINVERNKKISDYNYASAKQTTKETTIDNIHHTNVAYNRGDGKGYLTANPFAPSTLKQLTSDNEYGGNISSSINNTGAYKTTKFYAPATQKQFTSDNEYTGGANSYSKNTTNYNSMLNARTNPNKEIISKGRAPTQTGVKVMASTYEQGSTLYKKQNAVVVAGDHSTISINNGGSIPSNDLGNSVTNPRVSLSTRGLDDKINPNNLNALNTNPFHLSINRPNNDVSTDTDTDSYFGDIF